jgi:thiamine-monophosphate kinase
MASEFDLIDRHFRPLSRGAGVAVGIGDDTAILDPTPGHQLLATVDTMVAGVHFLPDTPARRLGYKAMAVNLSDIASMGGRPRWATLALTLAQCDEPWLADFVGGVGEACAEFGVALVGGDTTRGPLTLTIQLLGEVPRGEGLRRGGARVGDAVFVSGTLGDAGLGLACLQGRVSLPVADGEAMRLRLERPTPRVALGEALRGLASSAIDVSDGLLADFGHIAKASGVGARIERAAIPVSGALRDALQAGLVDWNLPLSAGDDYELLFTARAEIESEVLALGTAHDCHVTRIGTVTDGDDVIVVDEGGNAWVPSSRGYDHFLEDDA